MDNPIPENVKDIYDADTYHKWQAYHKEVSAAKIVSKVVSFVVYFALLAFNVFSKYSFSDVPFTAMETVVLFFVTVDYLMDSVFGYVYSMKIEEKYGFNKMKLRTFISDRIKNYIATLMITIGVTSAVIMLYANPVKWALVVFVLVIVCMLGGMFLQPLFSRLYNKFTPLEQGDLRSKLTALLKKNGYGVKKIQVMNASKRTTKSNAYFSGFGKTKTIVLYDTLLETQTTDEIVAVFAHELGHGLHKDILKNSAIGITMMMTIVVMAWLTVGVEAIYPYFGFEVINFGFALVLVMLVEFPLISPIFSAIAGVVSRRAEYRADAQAVKEGFGEALISSLKKLSNDKYS